MSYNSNTVTVSTLRDLRNYKICSSKAASRNIFMPDMTMNKHQHSRPRFPVQWYHCVEKQNTNPTEILMWHEHKWTSTVIKYLKFSITFSHDTKKIIMIKMLLGFSVQYCLTLFNTVYSLSTLLLFSVWDNTALVDWISPEVSYSIKTTVLKTQFSWPW